MRRFLAMVLLLSSINGCSRTTERRLYAAPCGSDTLALELRVITHAPAPSEVYLSLALLEGSRRRLIDQLKPRTSVWEGPRPEEGLVRLRSGADDWPVFVNPREFTVAEYDRLRGCIETHAAALDSSAARSRTGERVDFDNDLHLSSIRLLDYTGLGRSYHGPTAGATVELQPDGALWLRYKSGATLLGGVVDGGRRVVYSWNPAETVPGVADPPAYVMGAVDDRGHRLADEFAVERLESRARDSVLRVEREARARLP